MFGTMVSLWSLFYYSPQKAESLKHVQVVLNLPELKVIKPSDTRWLSHERCVCAILRVLPALITTLQSIYDECGDAEAYELTLVLRSYSGVATIVLLSAVLELLAKLNCFMQRKTTDFSRLPIVLDGILAELKHLKDNIAKWCSLVGRKVAELTDVHDISLQEHSVRNSTSKNITNYRLCIAIPYIEKLVSNINNRFLEASVHLLTLSAIFHPASIPKEEPDFLEYQKLNIIHNDLYSSTVFCG